MLERETREAIEHRVPDLLRRRVDGLDSLRADVVLRDPGPWVHFFEELKTNRAGMSDPAQAERLFAQGSRAIESNDFQGLKVAVRGLMQLSSERLKSEFNAMKSRRGQMTDTDKATALFAAGERAASANDMAELDMVIRQLKQLLSGVTQ
jgi:hypothetical protein